MVSTTPITIIIPVHYRQQHINEAIESYRKTQFPIIVADSSQEPIPGLDDDPRVTYLHTPHQLFYKKIYEALLRVETEFVIDAPDDDIVFLEALIEASSFLLENKEYSFCNARWNGDLKGNPVADRIREQAFISASPIERIRVGTSRGCWIAPNHSVIRTSVMRNIFKFTLDNPMTQAARQFDKSFLFLLLCYGNPKLLDCQLGYRRPNNVNIIGNLSIPVPECLARSKSWATLKTEWSRIEPLSRFLQSHGYKKEFSDTFVSEIFQSGKHF